jgi:hypothetical protein
MMDIAGSEMNQENEIEMLVDSLPDENRTIMQNYIQELDAPITAEEPLSREQIVSMVIMEDEDDSDESREEISCVQVKDARLGLETVIRYFEQQSDSTVFDFNDLRMFRKYLNLLSLKELESKRQQKIESYFT